MLVLGHRGAILKDAYFHQNSLGAFEEALESSDGFETDACVDLNGQLFVIHEAKYVNSDVGVEYCAGEHLDLESQKLLGDRRIDQLSTLEVESLRLKDGWRIPRLRDALEMTARLKGKVIDIELKAYDVVEPVIQLVGEFLKGGMLTPDQVVITSFNHPSLLRVRRQKLKVGVGAIFVGADQPTTPLFPWKRGSVGSYTALTQVALNNSELKEIQPDFFVIPQEILTRASVDMIGSAFPAAKIMAWVFTEKNNFDSADLIARLMDLVPTGRVTAMMVDNPREFTAALPESLRPSSKT